MKKIVFLLLVLFLISSLLSCSAPKTVLPEEELLAVPDLSYSESEANELAKSFPNLTETYIAREIKQYSYALAEDKISEYIKQFTGEADSYRKELYKEFQHENLKEYIVLEERVQRQFNENWEVIRVTIF